MNAFASVRLPRRNPFSTRYVRPGAIEFGFPDGTSASGLIARLAECGWRGEIVGPHGSGKSTLLATLLPHLTTSDRQIARFDFRAGERPLPCRKWQSELWSTQTLVVVDGYERLGWLLRRRLNAACRRRGAGLLVTAHQSVGLPPLFCTSPSPEVLQTLVDRLLPNDCDLIEPADVLRSYDARSGNVREALFRLYDLYELRRTA